MASASGGPGVGGGVDHTIIITAGTQQEASSSSSPSPARCGDAVGGVIEGAHLALAPQHTPAPGAGCTPGCRRRPQF